MKTARENLFLLLTLLLRHSFAEPGQGPRAEKTRVRVEWWKSAPRLG